MKKILYSILWIIAFGSPQSFATSIPVKNGDFTCPCTTYAFCEPTDWSMVFRDSANAFCQTNNWMAGGGEVNGGDSVFLLGNKTTTYQDIAVSNLGEYIVSYREAVHPGASGTIYLDYLNSSKTRIGGTSAPLTFPFTYVKDGGTGALSGIKTLSGGESPSATKYVRIRFYGVKGTDGFAKVDDISLNFNATTPQPTITINNVTATEGNSGTKAFTFTVSLSSTYTSTITVNYATANGTATTTNYDYAAASGTLTFLAGQTSKTITVNVTGDTNVESDETFYVNLSGASNATISDSQGLGTIQNDDSLTSAPSLSYPICTADSSGSTTPYEIIWSAFDYTDFNVFKNTKTASSLGKKYNTFDVTMNGINASNPLSLSGVMFTHIGYWEQTSKKSSSNIMFTYKPTGGYWESQADDGTPVYIYPISATVNGVTTPWRAMTTYDITNPPSSFYNTAIPATANTSFKDGGTGTNYSDTETISPFPLNMPYIDTGTISTTDSKNTTYTFALEYADGRNAFVGNADTGIGDVDWHGYMAIWYYAAPYDYGNADGYAVAGHGATLCSGALYIGDTRPDTESTTQSDDPGTASGDNTNGKLSDNDSLTPPNISKTDTSYSLSVPYHNNTGANATLAAWIDFNNNGQLEASERQKVTVAAGSGSVTLNWTGISVNSSATQLVLRLRIASQDSEVTSASGLASNGEVEDYVIAVNSVTTPPIITEVDQTCPAGYTLDTSVNYAPNGDFSTLVGAVRNPNTWLSNNTWKTEAYYQGDNLKPKDWVSAKNTEASINSNSQVLSSDYIAAYRFPGNSKYSMGTQNYLYVNGNDYGRAITSWESKSLTIDSTVPYLFVAHFSNALHSNYTAHSASNPQIQMGYYDGTWHGLGSGYTEIPRDTTSTNSSADYDKWHQFTYLINPSSSTLSLRIMDNAYQEGAWGDDLAISGIGLYKCQPTTHTVSGTVYNDINHNATKDASESGMNKTTYVKACRTDNTFVTSVQANSTTGAYSLNLPDGNYLLIEDASNTADCITATDVTGWISTTSNSLTTTVNGTAITNKNFGNFYGSTVSGYVFNDLNQDGHFDQGSEIGISNIDLLIKRCGENEFDTTSTDANGHYTFWVPVGVQGDYAVDNWIGVFEKNSAGKISTDSGFSDDYLSTGDEFNNGVGTQSEPTNGSDTDHNWLCFHNISGLDFDNGGYQLVGNNFGNYQSKPALPPDCAAPIVTNADIWVDQTVAWTHNANNPTGASSNHALPVIHNADIIASAGNEAIGGFTTSNTGRANEVFYMNSSAVPAAQTNSTYIEYSFTTPTNLSEDYYLYGASAVTYKYNSSAWNYSGAYKIQIKIDDNSAFSSPTTLKSTPIQIDHNNPTTGATATFVDDSGLYYASHYDFDTIYTLKPNTTYYVRIYPYNVTSSGKADGVTGRVIFDDLHLKIYSCGTTPQPSTDCKPVVTSIMSSGSRNDPSNINRSSVVAFDYDHRGEIGDFPTPVQVASDGEVGTVWGKAYNANTKKLYVASFLRRHADLSPDGLGAIYEIDVSDVSSDAAVGTPKLWMNLNSMTHLGSGATLFGYQSAASRGLGASFTPSHDVWAFSRVAKEGLGGLDLSDDFKKMYTMDMTNRQLLEIDLATQKVTNRYPVNDPGCAGGSGDVRPFGVDYINGDVYIGVTCSGETRKYDTDVNAHVMKLTGSTFTTVVSGATGFKWSGHWNEDIYAYGSNCGNFKYGLKNSFVPLITNMEIDKNGNMIIGVMGRNGFRFGEGNYAADPGCKQLITAHESRGFILRATPSGSKWILASTEIWDTNNGRETEHFFKDGIYAHWGSGTSQTYIGGMGKTECSGEEVILANLMDPLAHETGGTRFIRTRDGQQEMATAICDVDIDTSKASTTELYAGRGNSWEKSAGMGDIAYLAEPSGSISSPCDVIPNEEPTAALTQAQVSFDITGAGGEFGSAILNAITVNGQTAPFSELIGPDMVSYSFTYPHATSQYINYHGVYAERVTDGSATFDPALLSVMNDRDLNHFLALDPGDATGVAPGDYIDFKYNTPIKSAGDRYFIATERGGNNWIKIVALDQNGNPIPPIGNTLATGTTSPFYIDTGIDVTTHPQFPLSKTQDLKAVVYPLTAVASKGTLIYGLRVSYNDGFVAGDGGDGKIFIMVDPNKICTMAAQNDDFTPNIINAISGGTTGSVFIDNSNGVDLADNEPATDANIDDGLSIVDNGGLTGVTINTDGTLNIPAGTIASDYNLTYKACLNMDNSICDTAIATVKVNGSGISPEVDYHFDECDWNGTAGEVQDSSGNNHHGTAFNGANTDSDHIINRSGLFTKSDSQYLSVDGLDAVFGDTSSAFTLSAWVKPKTLSTDATNHSTKNTIFAKASDNKNDNFELGINTDGTVHLYIDTKARDRSTDFGNAGDITTNAWHYVAVIYDSGTVTVKIDDKEYTNSSTWSGATILDQAVGSPFTIGASLHIDNFFDGLMDEVKIYDTALSSSELNTIYDNEKVGKNPNGSNRDAVICTSPTPTPIGEFRFDDCGDNSTWNIDHSMTGNNAIGTPNLIQNDFKSYMCNAVANNSWDISIPDHAAYDIDEGTISILLYDHHNVWDTTRLISKGWDWNTKLYLAIENVGGDATKGTIKAQLANNVINTGETYFTTLSNGTDNDTQWTHITFSFGSKGMKLYINGELKGTNPYTGGLKGLGGDIAMPALSGYFDEFYIFDKQMNDTQVSELYNNIVANKNIDGTLRDCGCNDNTGTLGMLLTRGDGENNAKTNVYAFDVDIPTNTVTNFHLVKKLDSMYRSLVYKDGKFITAGMDGTIYHLDPVTGDPIVDNSYGKIDNTGIMAIDFDENNDILYKIWSADTTKLQNVYKYNKATNSSTVLKNVAPESFDDGIAYQGNGKYTMAFMSGGGGAKHIDNGTVIDIPKSRAPYAPKCYCVYGGEYVCNGKSYFINAEIGDLNMYASEGQAWDQFYDYGSGAEGNTGGLKGMAIAITRNCIPVAAKPNLTIADVEQLEGDEGITTLAIPVTLDKPAPAGGVTINFSAASSEASQNDFAPNFAYEFFDKLVIDENDNTNDDNFNDLIGYDPTNYYHVNYLRYYDLWWTFWIAWTIFERGYINEYANFEDYYINKLHNTPDDAYDDKDDKDNDKTGSTFGKMSPLSFKTEDPNTTDINNTIVIGEGDSTGEIIIPISGDTSVEEDESFDIIIDSASGAIVVDDNATAIIINDDINLTSGLVAEYRFDECEWTGAAGEVTDSGPNGLHATAMGGAELTAGVLNNAGKFDGNAYIDIPQNSELSLTGDMSMSFWVNPTDQTYSTQNANENWQQNFIVKGLGAEFRVDFWYDGTDQCLCVMYTHGNDSNMVNPDNDKIYWNQWYHFVLVRDTTAKVVHFYINGVLIDSKPYDSLGIGEPTSQLSGVTLSSGTTASKFKGEIDEVKFFNGAMSGGQATEIYNNERNGLNYDGTSRDPIVCQEPFTCDETLYLSNRNQSGTGNTDSGKTWLHSIDRSNIPYDFDAIGNGYTSSNGGYNALGYNIKDNFMYALYGNTLVRIDKNAIVRTLGTVAGLPSEQLYAGEFGRDGYYYVSGNGGADNKLYKIDVEQVSVVDTITLSQSVRFWDMAIDETGNYFYVMLISDGDADSDYNNDKVAKIDISNGNITTIGDSHSDESSYISLVYSDRDGDIFMVANADHFYKVDTVTGALYEMSSIQELTFYNDGTSCPDANISEPVALTHITNMEKFEGNSGTTTFNFTLQFSRPTEANSGFWVTYTDGVNAVYPIGTAGHVDTHTGDEADFDGTARYIALPIGITSYEINATVIGDTYVEHHEEFYVDIYAPNNLILMDTRAVGIILNDDTVNFRVERDNSGSIAAPTTDYDQQRKSNMYTQMVKKDFDYSVVSYEDDYYAAASDHEEFAIDDVTLKVDLYDYNTTIPNHKLMATRYLYFPKDAPKSREMVTLMNDLEVAHATRRAQFIVSCPVDGNNSIIYGNYSANETDYNRTIADHGGSEQVGYSEPFAIRPLGFNVVISDNMTEVTHNNTTGGKGLNPVSLAAEYLYRLSATAIRDTSGTLETEYKTDNRWELKGILDFDGSTTNCNILESVDLVEENTMKGTFSSGELIGDDFNHSEAGRYMFTLLDINWTYVDQNDTDSELSGCIVDYNNSERIGGKYGCNISSDIENNALFDPIAIEFEPYEFNITNTFVRNANGTNRNHVYMGDLSLSLDMGVEIGGDVIAQGKNHKRLYNFVEGCAAEAVNIDLQYLITSDQNLTDSTVYNKILTRNGTPMDFNYVYAFNGNAYNAADLDERLDNNITIPSSAFVKSQEGNSSVSILYNITKDLNEPMNPVKVIFSDLNASSVDAASYSNGSDNFIPYGGAETGQLDRNGSGTRFFYYSKVAPYQENYGDVAGTSLNTPIYVAIYCGDMNQSWCNTMINSNGLSESFAQSGWYTAHLHDSSTDGSISQLSVGDPSDSVTDAASLPNFHDGRAGRIEDITTATNHGSLPWRVTVTIDQMSPWLYHHIIDDEGKPFWRVNFKGNSNGVITGVGETGHITEIDANTNYSNSKGGKIDW